MNSKRKPFWLPASNYYVLAVAISTAFFFVVWGILHDGGEEAPWVTAGIGASMFLCGAVILRAILGRRYNAQMLRQQRAFGTRFQGNAIVSDSANPNKLTLERNAAILNEIGKKSEAAQVLNKLSAGHREVFELCSEYISQNESELKTVNAGSPRLAPLLKGRSAAAELHKYHLLKWAEIEVGTLTNEARCHSEPEDRINAAQGALNVIDVSLESYPSEPSLIQSKELLQDLVVSIRISDWMEKADRAVFDREYALAKSLYRDALFDLGRDNVQSAARAAAAHRINAEIDRIRAMESDD